MSGFAHFDDNIEALEKEIRKLGVALSIDWSNQQQVRAYAREALDSDAEKERQMLISGSSRDRNAAQLFGLANLMLHTMRSSAGIGVESHGGDVWKAFGRALFEEAAQSSTTTVQK